MYLHALTRFFFFSLFCFFTLLRIVLYCVVLPVDAGLQLVVIVAAAAVTHSVNHYFRV